MGDVPECAVIGRLYLQATDHVDTRGHGAQASGVWPWMGQVVLGRLVADGGLLVWADTTQSVCPHQWIVFVKKKSVYNKQFC